MNKHPRTKKILFALVLSIAISANFADASTIDSDKNISANSTFSSDSINTINYKFLKSKIKGQVTGFASTTPTLDSIKPRVETYINNPVIHELTKIPPGEYSPTNAVTLVINGEDYYYIPDSAEDTGFLQLMATYANTLVKETVDASKAIYSYGGKMYTYDTEKLPLSVYRVDNGTLADYNYVTYTKQTNGPQTQSYYLVKLQPSQMKIEGIDWTQKDDGSGYTWPTYTPASSDAKFTESGDNLTKVEGAVRFNLPYNSESTKTQYYKYEYNIPTTYTRQASQVKNQDVNNKYFYNLNGSATGIAVGLSSGEHTIKADFINNRTTGSGTIATTTNVSVSKIEGNFIKNTAKEGGCMHIQGGHIKEIIGNFVGNSVSGNSQGKSNGGALNIWSGAVVDSIHGVFVGNTAANNSGAINNGGQTTASTIKVITGDFIANSALKGNGGAILNEKTTGGTDSKIYAITGDYIGNKAKGSEDKDNTGRGGAIYNRGLIYDVIGDYIGNAAEGSTSNSTTGLGGAIYNENSMRYVTGDYVGNSATNDGGAIYNAGNITSVTADFIGNRTSNGKGAGIYNSGTMALVAETKDMLFYDNKDNTKYNDIYQNNGTIAINAAENHNIIFNGTIEGDNGTININNGTAQNINGNYEFNNIISGNNIAIFNGAKIKLDKITQTNNTETYGVFNLSGNTFKNDANGGSIDTINDHIDAQNLGSVTLNSDINFKFDMNLATKVTDTIEASYSSSGTRNIILSDINLLGTKSWGDFGESDLNKKIQILTSDSASLQLGLSTDLETLFENKKVLLDTTPVSNTPEDILPTTNWDKEYKNTIVEKKKYGRWNLAQTTTENDSLGFTSVVRNESRKESMGDTLYLVNKDTTNATKDFTANENGATYTLTTDLDYNSASTKGTLNINGIANDDTETLNLNGHKGFELADSNSKLNFNNITVGDNTKTPATTTIATVTNGSATVGLNNAILNGNINSDVNYNLSIAGTTTVNGTLDKSNTTFNGTELQFNTDTFKNATLNVESGAINLRDSAFSTYEIDKLVSSDSARYNINLTFDNGVLKADKFKVGVNSSGTIHLGDLSISLPTDDSEHIVQIIDASNSNIRLDYTESSVLTEATANMSSDEILAKGFGLYTQNTINDSIKVRGLQDTFKAWANYATTNDKQFTFVEGADKEIPNSFSFDGNNKATIINNGTVTNNGTLSNLAITNNNTFKNDGQISDISLTNSGTFTNNSSTLSVKSGSNTNTINGTGTFTIAENGIYINSGTINNAVINNGTLTSDAEKLGGTIENNSVNSVLNLSGTLAKAVSGDSGTTKVNGTLSLNTGASETASIAGTLDMNNGTVTISGGSTPSVTTHNIGKIVGNGNLNIDMNLSEQTSDKINLAKASSGTLTINSVNIIDSATTQIDKNFSVKILNPQVESSIQLALSSDVQEQFANHEYISDSEGESITTDEVQATTPWTQDFYEKHITTARTEYSKLGLSDDKQSITITERREVGGVTTDTSLGDTLKVVNGDNILANKSFKSTDANDVYTVKEDLDVTNGNVTVEGVVDSTGESVVRSTIDFNSKNGFVLDESNASITLKNVEIKNASMLIGGIAEDEVEVVLNNVNLHDNGTGIQTGGNVKIEGNSTITDNIKVIGADSEININSNDTVTLNSILTGTGASNKLNISNGTVNLGNNTSITGLNTTFNNTTINLANESSLNGLNTTFNGNNNLNMANNSTKTLALGNVNINGVLNMQIDADLANAKMDQISASSATIGAGGRIDVSKINLMSPTTQKQLDLLFTDNSTLAGVVNYTGEGQIVYSPIYKYNTSYVQKGDGKGYFSFASAGSSPSDFNPAVMASSVATIVTGYQNQMQALHQGFYHMDRYMKYSDSYRLAAENQNKIASLAPFTNLDINRVPETSQAMWVLPYTTFERVNLKGGVNVNNISYGMTYGGDSDMFDMGHGFKGVISGFVGYNGNHMTYDGVSITQNGGFLGATLNAYRGNFFTGLTVSTGASTGDADTMYGHDNITLLTAGIANKTGYNFEFMKGKVILQPSLFLGYSWVNTFDYTNSAGIKIKQDALNALQIAPGLKLIGNTKNGWQPYAGIDMVWNIFMGRNQATANDVVLPKLSERAYVQYGVGIQKTWADRFTGFLQAMVRNGGRNGIVLSAGFRWTFGKAFSSRFTSAKNKNITKQNRTVIKQQNKK